MLATAQEIPVDVKLAYGIGELFEDWFENIEVPQIYRMNIPLILLFREAEKGGAVYVYLFFDVLLYQHGGNC